MKEMLTPELAEWALFTNVGRKSEGVGWVAYEWEKDTSTPASRRLIDHSLPGSL